MIVLAIYTAATSSLNFPSVSNAMIAVFLNLFKFAEHFTIILTFQDVVTT